MDKISIADALEFAEENFPNAPEKLAELLKIEIRRSPLNCDGWCLQINNRSIIRINNNTPEVRQRFTLAHELGHLICGIPTVVGESTSEIQHSTNEEEKIVNYLAAKLLLPQKKIKSFIPEIPITSTVIKKIAKKAKVSELFVARRLASFALDLGLKDGLVLFYENNNFKWQWSETVWMSPELAQKLLTGCLEVSPNPARIHREEQSDVIVASIIENPYLDTKTIFLQIVHEEDGLKKLTEESIRDLEDFIFENNREFRMSLQGCFGAFKSKVKELSLEEAMRLFNLTYLKNSERWGEDIWKRLSSEKGQKYIKLRLHLWVKSQ